MSVGAGSTTLTHWDRFIQSLTYYGISPININGETLILSFPFEHLTQATYSRLFIASLSSSRLSFPDLTASIMDFGEAEIRAVAVFRDA